MNKFRVSTFVWVLLVSFGAGVTPAKAGLLQLSHDPLFLNQTVPPAIAVTLDDSGSMAWGYLGTSSRYNAFADPEQNLLYYNPNIVYAPPIKADGTQMPQIDPEKAPLNGYHAYGSYGKIQTVDLTNDYRPIYHLYYYRDGSYNRSYTYTISAATNDGKYTRAFYLTRDSSGNYTEHQITDSAELDNFANWYSYYNTRLKLARAAISRAFAGFGPDFKVDWQLLNKNTRYDELKKFEGTHRNNFYSFLFSAPSEGGTPLRASFVRAGDLFKQDTSYKSDDFNTTLSCQQNFHIAVSDGGWNGSFSAPSGFDRDQNNLSPLPGDTGTTSDPNAKYGGYTGTGEQRIFKSDYSHWNYGRNLADIAFHYWVNDLKPTLNNNVKRYKKDYLNADGLPITFTTQDEWENPEFVWNPKNNPAYWQHLVTYNVGLGLEASLVVDHMEGKASCSKSTNSDSKEAIYEALRNGDCKWPDSDNVNTTRIDDVWHASINSRGGFFGANDPDELIKALNNVVNDILERLGRGSTSTVSSGVITNDTLAFSPLFDSSKWTGNLIAREVKNNGEFGDAKWDAACVLTGGSCAATGGNNVTKQSIRKIFTYDKSLGLMPFDSSLNSTLKSELLNNASDLIVRTGVTVNQLIDYVKGDQTKEIQNNGVLRNRASILADIIHASPTVVTGPSEFYDDWLWPVGSKEQIAYSNDQGYINYQKDQLNRQNIIYMGSNSGMLHAFNAESQTTTEEYWAYMPSKAFDNIHRLADPQFKHWSYVDNTPVVRDAFINNSWRTTLVGGMRYGGQAFYALDVTQAASSSPQVLWEFTDEDDPDMGYSYGQASVVRIGSTGEWVALLPNGYNNTQHYIGDPSNNDDKNVSSSGNAVLFVVRLSDGQLLAKLDTGVGSVSTPNGLATAVAVDSRFSLQTNSTEKGVDIGADYAYAGDLYGNLWKFDFSSKNYSDWSSKITRVVKANNVMDRPITTQPRVVQVPKGEQSKEKDVVVIFGTGKYIEIPDRSINLPDDQYLVGLVDGLGSGNKDLDIDSSNFVSQSFLNAGTGGRRLSENLVDLGSKSGWKLKLPEQGERLANPLTLIGSKLVLASTTVTAGIDPCEAGGRSWLTAFNPYTGGKTEFGRIFRNKNGTVVQDVDSILINDLIIGRPPLLESPGEQKIIVEGADDTSIVTIQSYTWRRRNWTNLLTE